MSASDFIDTSSVPKWVNLSALGSYLSADWTEKYGRDYLSDFNNNLKWTTDIDSSINGASTATLVSKATYYKPTDFWYPSSLTFTLAGEDKTSLKLDTALSEPISESLSMSYSAGAGTTTKADDVTFLLRNSENKATSTSNYSYKDGLGTSIIFSYKENYKSTDATGYDYHGNGTWSGNGSLSYSDAQKNRLSASVYASGELIDGAMTAGAYSILVGSFQNSQYSVTWAKVDGDVEIKAQLDGLLSDSSSFPMQEIFNALNPYVLKTSNTVKLFSVAMTSAEFDAGDGNDIITGGVGDDIISGGIGNDTINGAAGNDVIISGLGADKLSGGKGDDLFVFKREDYDFTSIKTVLADSVSDFKYVANIEQDSVRLDAFGSIEVYKTIAAAKLAGSTANVIYESGTGKFWYNEDGDDALAGIMAFATIKGIPDSYWVAAGVLSV
jgi:Ca2+-binding RTX toxin-like protein